MVIEQILRHGVSVEYLVRVLIPMRSLLTILILCFALTSHAKEVILDLKSGQPLTREQLIEQIKVHDILLLGEIHDNHRHHAIHGELLRDIGTKQPFVVAEHLTYGKTYTQRGDLLDDLTAAGFDGQGWDWPTHLQLFAPIAKHDIPLVGGNLPLEAARKIAREGETALPDEFARILRAAPLPALAAKTLDQDLLDGHCGHLKASMLPNMRLTQRARDAAMFAGLRTAPAGKLKVLVAGNGHIRMDYGVPVIIEALMPQSRWMSVAFIEADGDIKDQLSTLKQRYTHVWITEATIRDDPCAGFGKR
jgi:uncharacterized iron-regulated protein